MSGDPGHPAEQAPGYGAGLFFLGWAALGWYAVLTNAPVMRSLTAPGLDPGPGVLPVMVCTALSLGGLWLTVRGLTRSHAGVTPISLRGLAVPLGFLGSALFAALLTQVIPFRGAAFAFAVVWLVILDTGQPTLWRRMVRAALLAVSIVALIEVVFVQLLRVPLP